jgi:Raf kinase inhibitor-like YbhB/YbcL family protein
VSDFIVMDRLVVSLDFLEFPPTHTCDGGNLSPRLTLKGLNASSVAVMIFNPFEKSCCSFTPWIVWNIPPVQQIPPGIPPGGRVTSPIPAVQGITDYGTIGYTGPCPPHGQMIRYLFRVYGLDAMLDLTAGSNKHELITAMKGHVIQFGDTAAICSR